MNKLCIICGQLKDLGDFYMHPTAKDGYKNICKACTIERSKGTRKKYRDAHKDEHRRYSLGYRKQAKLLAMGHYGGARCACCGEAHIEFLCFDHIGGGGTQHRKSLRGRGRQFYKWLIAKGYPEGYRVLCYNCNMSLGFYGYCPHGSLKIQKEED